MQSESLLQEIEKQASEECRAIFEAAEREAHAVVAQAYANARRRTHEATTELRREGGRRLARAKAQAATETRKRAQQYTAEAIRRAWPLLVDVLIARWHDPAARRAWVDSAARHARDRMRGEAWNIEHPANWSAEEQRYFCNALGIDDHAVTFTADRDIAAGIRIRATQATLDATVQGLLADRPTIAALLLAELPPQSGNTCAAQDGAG